MVMFGSAYYRKGKVLPITVMAEYDKVEWWRGVAEQGMVMARYSNTSFSNGKVLFSGALYCIGIVTWRQVIQR